MAGAAAFDEIRGTPDDPAGRPEFAPLSDWIENTPAAELDRRQKAAEAAFRQLGITFAVYGEDESAERIIPFDIVPRVFTARDLASGAIGNLDAAPGSALDPHQVARGEDRPGAGAALCRHDV